jgi:hypothetical protein
MVIPFLLARESRNFRVIGGCAQYCTARSSIVTIAAEESVSVLATIVDAAPPLMKTMGLRFNAVVEVNDDDNVVDDDNVDDDNVDDDSTILLTTKREARSSIGGRC